MTHTVTQEHFYMRSTYIKNSINQKCEKATKTNTGKKAKFKQLSRLNKSRNTYANCIFINRFKNGRIRIYLALDKLWWRWMRAKMRRHRFRRKAWRSTHRFVASSVSSCQNRKHRIERVQVFALHGI